MAAVEKTRFPASTVVRAIRYMADRRGLEVTFNSGSVYLYHGVPPQIFDCFRSAESAGTFLNRHVLDRYRFTRLK